MKVEIRFSIFLDEEKEKKNQRTRRRSKISSNKQFVDLNFLSIFVSHFCWFEKKKESASLQSLLESYLTYPRYIYPSAILLVLILLHLIPQSLILHNFDLLTEIQLIVASKIHFFGEEGFDVGVEGLPVGVFEMISGNWGDWLINWGFGGRGEGVDGWVDGWMGGWVE